MPEEKFSPEESLQLIQSMISKTRQSMSDNSIYFLVWGWVTFFAFIAQFILKYIFRFEKHYLVWTMIIPAIVFSIYQGKKERKLKRVKTYIDESMRYLWMGMAVVFFVLSLILSRLGWGISVYPFFIMLYGLGTFVSGNLLRFRPLIVGGILAWGLAVGSAWVGYDYQMLFGAAAILVSYIIPAFLLRKRNKIANT